MSNLTVDNIGFFINMFIIVVVGILNPLIYWISPGVIDPPRPSNSSNVFFNLLIYQ